MSPGFDLDHVGIAVHDLDGAAAVYRRLGFTLSDRSYHVAPASPGAAPTPRGTGNHCVMLSHGYVELIGITDPAYRGGLRQHLAQNEGLHIVAFGCTDAATAGMPRRLTRPIVERGKSVTAEFSIVDLPAPVGNDTYIAIEHHSRAALWQPHLLPHANGARGLLEMTVCAADPAAYAAKLAATLGVAVQANGDAHTVRLAFGSVDTVDPAGLERRYSGVAAPALPFLAGIALTADDIARTCALLRANGADYRSRPTGSIWIAPAQACGAVIEFIPA